MPISPYPHLHFPTFPHFYIPIFPYSQIPMFPPKKGWIDWNLLVDHKGGPNHLDNMCDASIITNADFSDVYVQPKYFYLGHFAKFATPGSVRVQASAVGMY
jgi:O-glycosyl hydrolase